MTVPRRFCPICGQPAPAERTICGVCTSRLPKVPEPPPAPARTRNEALRAYWLAKVVV